jgi:transcriptional regulator
MSKADMSKTQRDLPYGTLDPLVLKTLEAMGTMNGYAIARRIEQVCGESMQISQGSIYPALIGLQQEGWIATEWGVSETNRKVKLYSITKAGRKQLQVEVARWQRATGLVARFLESGS